MDNLAHTCPRCQGTMETGYVMDRGHYSAATEPEWVEGDPERSFWTGLKTRGKERYAVTTYRCARCGFLESYAQKPV